MAKRNRVWLIELSTSAFQYVPVEGQVMEEWAGAQTVNVRREYERDGEKYHVRGDEPAKDVYRSKAEAFRAAALKNLGVGRRLLDVASAQLIESNLYR